VRVAVAILGIGVLVATGCASGATDQPADVTDTAATLRAHGSAGGKSTLYWFEYGTTTAYGNSTPNRNGGSGTTQQNVSERITGLTPNTLYHYRACAANADGRGCGVDVTFRTGSLGMLPGFQESVAFSGLTEPTAVRFASDGRVFVAEKSGIIKVFDGLGDTTPTTVADIRPKVHNYWDRGLLGFNLDPEFPAKPFLYVLYVHDAAIGGTAPRWNDGCPTPPGPTTDGCVVSGRLSRLQLTGNQTGPEQVLVEDWCQQFPSHSMGDIAFGADGALYASAGEGGSWEYTDWGQAGSPKNPCGDPPGGVGANQTPPTAEGGSLRAQDVLTAGDPTGLSGSVIRVNRETGEALPDNPNASSSDPDARRIIAYGLRNPYRLAIRPGTSEPWVADAGWVHWEEINRITRPAGGPLENFGWPCFAGDIRQSTWERAGLNLCKILYTLGGAKNPYYTYNHGSKVFPEETCPTGSSAVSAVAFTPPGSPLPAEFDGALFFADYSRNCIWVMERNGGTLPSPARIRAFRTGAAGPVSLEFGPGGDLYYPDIVRGRIIRIRYTQGNQAPRAAIGANPTNGPTPLTVTFNAGFSSDPDPGDTISYAWDLDGDGAYDDGTGPDAQHTYANAGRYLAGVKVTDNHGAWATDSIAISAGNTPPTATIVAPSAGLTWKVGDPISFSGSATDAQDGNLAAARLSWRLSMQHCPSNCHEHIVQNWTGVASGSFGAPDHDYPSYLELQLTATDSGGLTDTRTIRLDPKTVQLSFATNPTGLTLAVNGASSTTPFSRTVIQGSANGIAAPTPQTLASATYDFSSWSDGGLAAHNVTADTNRSFTATYTRR
jgi:glucose/arabinose dehydrogenase